MNNNRIIQLILILCACVLLFAGCVKKDGAITFTATVDEALGNSIIISTTDDVGFDKASVGFSDSLEIDFNLAVGQRVSITIQPEIRESYPVQVTATKIEIVEEIKMEYTKITGDEAADMMGDDVIVLDARTQDEFDSGHIKNALLLPYDEITAETAEALLPDKSKTILVYCRTGRRSAVATKALLELGYASVYDFGGIATDWNGEVVK